MGGGGKGGGRERERKKKKRFYGEGEKNYLLFFTASAKHGACVTPRAVKPYPRFCLSRRCAPGAARPRSRSPPPRGCSDAERSEVAPGGGRCWRRGAERGCSAGLRGRGAGAAPTSGRSHRNHHSHLCFIIHYYYCYLFLIRRPGNTSPKCVSLFSRSRGFSAVLPLGSSLLFYPRAHFLAGLLSPARAARSSAPTRGASGTSTPFLSGPPLFQRSRPRH